MSSSVVHKCGRSAAIQASHPYSAGALLLRGEIDAEVLFGRLTVVLKNSSISLIYRIFDCFMEFSATFRGFSTLENACNSWQ